MKRAIYRKYDVGTAKYVIAHGTFQRSRGKNLSASFKGEKNPRKAWRAASNEIMARNLLDFDAIGISEKLVEDKLLGNDVQMWLGLGLHIAKTALLQKTLKNSDDTSMRTEISEYIRIVKEEGFEEIFSEPFKNGKEMYYIFYQKGDGILLSFCTYGGDSVNGGRFYYNWKPKDMKKSSRYISSGGYNNINGETIWVGDHDCREALRMHINDLRGNGKFIVPWVKQPFLWLLHYEDEKLSDMYEEFNDNRIKEFPKEVRMAICS